MKCVQEEDAKLPPLVASVDRDSKGSRGWSGCFVISTIFMLALCACGGGTSSVPAISSISASPISATTAVINWTTDVVADSQVEYGLTTAYGSITTLNASLNTAHSETLTGLSPNALYHFRVKSSSISNNLTTSADHSFTTATQSSGSICSKVTQYGISWEFSSEVPCGQFITGDYWVLGPVTVLRVSPGWDGTRNGSMLDPTPLAAQGFDSRINTYYPYSEANRVSFPVTISGGTKSLVSAISLAQNKIGGAYQALSDMAVLTVVSAVPPAGSFRPAFVSGSKKMWNTSEVNYSLVPTLPVPSGITVPDMSHEMVRINPYFGPQVWSTTIIPENNVTDVYPAYENQASSVLALEAMLDIPQKKTYINRMIQRGIDHYSIALQNDDGWQATGGFHVGLKWPIVFAGILLNDAGMKSPPMYIPSLGNGSNIFKFSEDGYTYLGAATPTFPAGKPGFGLDYIGMGFVLANCNSNCMARDPAGLLDPEDRPNGGGYRQTVSPNWVGQALAAYLMKAKSTWNHDLYFSYVDRWLSEPQTWTDASDTRKRNVYGYGDESGLVQAMWNLYRAQSN